MDGVVDRRLEECRSLEDQLLLAEETVELLFDHHRGEILAQGSGRTTSVEMGANEIAGRVERVDRLLTSGDIASQDRRKRAVRQTRHAWSILVGSGNEVAIDPWRNLPGYVRHEIDRIDVSDLIQHALDDTADRRTKLVDLRTAEQSDQRRANMMAIGTVGADNHLLPILADFAVDDAKL